METEDEESLVVLLLVTVNPVLFTHGHLRI